jgi:hypothetical protein
MKPIHVFTVAMVCVFGTIQGSFGGIMPPDKSVDASTNAALSSGGDRPLVQSATGGSGAGKTKPQPAARAKKGAITTGKHLTLHDQKQISRNLNGGTKGKNTYLKDAAVSKEGSSFTKQSFGDGSNGGGSSPAAVDSFSKQGFIKGTH